MTVKLDIYRKFTNALAVAVILSVIWICYEVKLLGDHFYILYQLFSVCLLCFKYFGAST